MQLAAKIAAKLKFPAMIIYNQYLTNYYYLLI